MSGLQKVDITPKALKLVRSGGLWIFSNEIKQKLKGIEPGTLAEFYCQGQRLGIGYLNPHSLIAGRLLAFHSVPDWTKFFREKIGDADSRREHYKSRGSYRVVFSEADQLPGLIVDLYVRKNGERVLVAQSNTAGMDTLRPHWQQALLDVFSPKGFVVRGDSSIRHLEQVPLFTDTVRGQQAELKAGECLEDDLYFACDFVEGQKTGFFLDQKENRLLFRGLSAGRTVADLCSYSGAWGMNALKGGAKHVTFVDQSGEALELAKKTLRLNNVSESKASFVEKDVFDYLDNDSEKFDAVVADPPAFIKSKKNLNQGMKAYARLNSLSLKHLREKGLLVSCSCSFHMAETELEAVITHGLSLQERIGTVIQRGRQADDHPWLLNRPETHYLKSYFLEA